MLEKTFAIISPVNTVLANAEGLYNYCYWNEEEELDISSETLLQPSRIHREFSEYKLKLDRIFHQD